METRRAGITTWVVFGVVVLVVAGAAWWYTQRGAPAVVAMAVTHPVAVRTIVVVSGPAARWASVVGTLVSRNDLTVATEGNGGRVTQLLVDVGDQVTVGQEVAKLDDTAALIQRAQAEATRLRAVAMVKQQEAMIAEGRATLADVTAALRRIETLGTGVASEEAVEQRRTSVATTTARLNAAEQALDVSKAEVAQAETQVRDATLAVERTTLRAPAAGVVLTRDAKLGAVVNAGTVLLRLAQDGTTEFAAEVTEDVLQLVQVGQPVELEAGGTTTTGTVRRVDPALDPATRLGGVRVTLTHPEVALRPGLSVRGQIRVATGEGPLVPSSAVLDDGGGTVVMVVADGHARRRPVTKLLRAGSQVLVGEGLAVGEQVIARAPNFVPDGEAVIAVASEGEGTAR